MTIVLKVLKWAFLLILLLVVFALTWPWSAVVQERLTARPFASYLDDNLRPLDLDIDDAGFAFDDAFYDHDLFLLGEIHGAQMAQDVDLAMMKHLNQRAGVRWLMAELSYVQAARFNAFLDTGEESYLAPVFEKWLASSTQWGNQQHYDKILAVRAYNMTLPPERRLRYFGVDSIGEDSQADAAAWLAGLLSDLPDTAPEALLALRAAALDFDPENFAAVGEAALAAFADYASAPALDASDVGDADAPSDEPSDEVV